jgi:1,4-dihydroxy-2-naphthoyl-CoA hydrolase
LSNAHGWLRIADGNPHMTIWTQPVDLDALNALTRNTIAALVGIRFTEIGDDYLRATMPVDPRTHQPIGLLHGGASVVLAETLGSMAGHCALREGGRSVVGIEVNANHLRGVRDGNVTGTARPVHIGSSTQVWEIRIEDATGRLVCLSRLTLSVLTREVQAK